MQRHDQLIQSVTHAELATPDGQPPDARHGDRIRQSQNYVHVGIGLQLGHPGTTE